MKSFISKKKKFKKMCFERRKRKVVSKNFFLGESKKGVKFKKLGDKKKARKGI